MLYHLQNECRKNEALRHVLRNTMVLLRFFFNCPSCSIRQIVAMFWAALLSARRQRRHHGMGHPVSTSGHMEIFLEK